MGRDTFKPGERDGPSGQYREVGRRGGERSDREITHVEGKPLPPTSQPGDRWELVDPTRHKGQ